MFFKSLQPLLPYLKRYRWNYIAGSVCVLVSNGAWVLFPLIIHRAVDGLERGVSRHALRPDIFPSPQTNTQTNCERPGIAAPTSPITLSPAFSRA